MAFLWLINGGDPNYLRYLGAHPPRYGSWQMFSNGLPLAEGLCYLLLGLLRRHLEKWKKISSHRMFLLGRRVYLAIHLP